MLSSLSWLVKYFFPGLGQLLFGIAAIWGLFKVPPIIKLTLENANLNKKIIHEQNKVEALKEEKFFLHQKLEERDSSTPDDIIDTLDKILGTPSTTEEQGGANR